MQQKPSIDYERVAEAINYLKLHFKDQPRLSELASIVHLSPYHFQRIFTEWAGTSPKKFLQYITVEHAKKMLAEQATLLETAYETGLSGTGRLHDLFVNIEGMTPAEYKNGGANLHIHYEFYSTVFGKLFVASTPKGICYAAFVENNHPLKALQSIFPNAMFFQSKDPLHEKALAIFTHNHNHLAQIKLHLKGTDFQLKVWNALLGIPAGKLTTYSAIADRVSKPNAARAVGTAIGSNPVAYLIPCHRVIRSNGIFGEYMWGNTRKTAMIGWEMSKVNVGDNLPRNALCTNCIDQR
ncbi:methylated-DNA--[protein]-cysteine S-methyltransferase [Haoranjiania flava]|uniref:methylated-DNA--[protein]-cysteine S-methyltransferase n=1 Tax=Haoranjiania flava TaxID=1856322 RepID=UPI00295000A3|nr:methylated-DNA--[protein]-cysteine S-methyltransferase [Haoranjiania flava]